MLGPPGAGKGTQAKQLAAKLKLPHISTGDILRTNESCGTELGIKAKGFMNKGALVPDELVTQMLINRLNDPDTQGGFILDGYPRTIVQAEALDAIVLGKNSKIDLVMYLEASVAVIIQRITGRLVCKKCGANFHEKNMPPRKDMLCDICGATLCRRSDDTAETIKKRIEVYNNEVSTLVKYYAAQNKLERLNADGSAGAVLAKMMDLVSLQHDSH